MRPSQRSNPYLFGELGSVEFGRLCRELLASAAGLRSAEWRKQAFGDAVVSDSPVRLGAHEFAPPTLVIIAWIRDAHLQRPRRGPILLGPTSSVWPGTEPASVVILTNARADEVRSDEPVPTTILGAGELTDLVRASPEVRLRAPSVLGVCDLADIIEPDVRERSTGDLAGAAELARVFVPTRAYYEALRALEAYHFTFLTGPPEMGKTAAARMVGLAKLTAGWELQECTRPANLWQRYRRERKQVFIADDAFGSTEYRPEAAERWALELDRVLRAMDESHWLLWTSRPAPLKAALRRIHREHGVERFPAPAQVAVDAAALEVDEKALILYRHARAARLPRPAIALVRARGWEIVSHEHFTPERIRRLVATRLQVAAEGIPDPAEVKDMVDAQIREPTQAMAASFRALAPEQRAVLVAMLDCAPGPIPERELLAAMRQHLHTLHAKSPTELLDRLTDHFLRRVEPASVTWVHPSWRDLVIEELATEAEPRRTFLRDCSLEGILLALSTGGGVAGERALPLLLEDADWDLVADRLADLVPDLDDPATVRLIGALTETRAVADDRRAGELEALAGAVLEQLARMWNGAHAVIPIGVLAAWFDLAAALAQEIPPPYLAATWIELLPTERVEIADRAELARLDDWLGLVRLLRERVAEQLGAFGFPERQSAILRGVVVDAQAFVDAKERPPIPELLNSVLGSLADLAPEHAVGARAIAYALARAVERPERHLHRAQPRPISDELRAFLDAPPSVPASEKDVVARILRDL